MFGVQDDTAFHKNVPDGISGYRNTVGITERFLDNHYKILTDNFDDLSLVLHIRSIGIDDITVRHSQIQHQEGEDTEAFFRISGNWYRR